MSAENRAECKGCGLAEENAQLRELAEDMHHLLLDMVFRGRKIETVGSTKDLMRRSSKLGIGVWTQ